MRSVGVDGPDAQQPLGLLGRTVTCHYPEPTDNVQPPRLAHVQEGV